MAKKTLPSSPATASTSLDAEIAELSERLARLKAQTRGKSVRHRVRDRLTDRKIAVLSIEDRKAAVEREATDQLVASFRSAAPTSSGWGGSETSPATAEIEEARLAVERTQSALDTVREEAEATRRQLIQAQNVVGRAVADVVRQELLTIARQIDEHDQAAAELRDSMRRAGFVTANVARRNDWPARIFTSTMVKILDRQTLDGTSRADWQGFITRLDDDHEAPLE